MPQSINKFGTYAVRAREAGEAERLKRDAAALAEAGCFGLVLEKYQQHWPLKWLKMSKSP